MKKVFILAGLVGILAYLTLTKSGKGLALKIGSKIMEVSSAGIDAIMQHEGFSPVPYIDAMGLSIGFGHFILPGEKFTRITREEGRALLAQDTAKANAAVKSAVKVPLTQNQHDALVGLVYNIGGGAFKGSTLLRKLNAGNYSGAAEWFLPWNKSRNTTGVLSVNPGLTKRRMAEREQFLSA